MSATFSRNAAADEGVYCEDGNLSIVDGELRGNTAEHGGGLYAAPGDAVLEGVRFLDNVAAEDGGGALIDGGNTLTITDVRFEGNAAGATRSGGGLHAREVGTVDAVRTRFVRNEAGYGGGAYVDEANGGRWTNVVFHGNVAGSGGGLCAVDAGEQVVRHATFASNAGTQDGGAVYTSETTLDLGSSLVTGTTAGERARRRPGSPPGRATGRLRGRARLLGRASRCSSTTTRPTVSRSAAAWAGNRATGYPLPMTQTWRIGIGFGEAVVHAEGWLDALARGLPELGLDLGGLGQLSIEPQDDGGAIARDPVTDLEIRIEPVDGGAFDMPTPSVDAVGRVAGPDDADPFDAPAPRFVPRAVAPPVAPPVAQPRAAPAEPATMAPRGEPAAAEPTPRPSATVVPAADPDAPPFVPDERTAEGGLLVGAGRFRGLPDDLVEDLFLRLGEISTATGVAAASGIALRILLDLVPAGAGAVLIRTRAGDGLRFRAASGPAAGRLVDTVIPLERGIAGFVCQFGVALSVADARRDRRHDARVDRATGFTTRGMLAVPVRADSGAIFGCIELLNPPRPYTDQDLEVAGRVAASLGTFLQSVYTAR